MEGADRGRSTSNFGDGSASPPPVLVGKPVIRGARIPVELIARMLEQGISESDILHEYPRLQRHDIHAALAYAARVLARQDIFQGARYSPASSRTAARVRDATRKFNACN